LVKHIFIIARSTTYSYLRQNLSRIKAEVQHVPFNIYNQLEHTMLEHSVNPV